MKEILIPYNDIVAGSVDVSLNSSWENYTAVTNPFGTTSGVYGIANGPNRYYFYSIAITNTNFQIGCRATNSASTATVQIFYIVIRK